MTLPPAEPDWVETFWKIIEAVHWTPAMIADLTLPQWFALSRNGGKGAGIKVPLGDATAMQAVEEAWLRTRSPEALAARAERIFARRYPHLAG